MHCKMHTHSRYSSCVHKKNRILGSSIFPFVHKMQSPHHESFHENQEGDRQGRKKQNFKREDELDVTTTTTEEVYQLNSTHMAISKDLWDRMVLQLHMKGQLDQLDSNDSKIDNVMLNSQTSTKSESNTMTPSLEEYPPVPSVNVLQNLSVISSSIVVESEAETEVESRAIFKHPDSNPPLSHGTTTMQNIQSSNASMKEELTRAPMIKLIDVPAVIDEYQSCLDCSQMPSFQNLNYNFEPERESDLQNLSTPFLKTATRQVKDSANNSDPDTSRHISVAQEAKGFIVPAPEMLAKNIFSSQNSNLYSSEDISVAPFSSSVSTAVQPSTSNTYTEQFRHLSPSPPFLLKHGKQLFLKIADMIGILMPKNDRHPSLADVCNVIEGIDRQQKGDKEETGFALSLILHQVILHDDFICMPDFDLHLEEIDVQRAFRLYNSWRAQQSRFLSSVYAAASNKPLSNALCASLTTLEEESTRAFEASKGVSSSCLNSLTSIMLDCFKGSKYRFITLAVVGSSGNTLSLLDSSDLDLTLLVDDDGSSLPASDIKSVAIEILKIVMNSISQQPGLFFVKELVVNAKVPVLKLVRDTRDVSLISLCLLIADYYLIIYVSTD